MLTRKNRAAVFYCSNEMLQVRMTFHIVNDTWYQSRFQHVYANAHAIRLHVISNTRPTGISTVSLHPWICKIVGQKSDLTQSSDASTQIRPRLLCIFTFSIHPNRVFWIVYVIFQKFVSVIPQGFSLLWKRNFGEQNPLKMSCIFIYRRDCIALVSFLTKSCKFRQLRRLCFASL